MELHPRLATIAEHLEATGWAAELCDPGCGLVWVSTQLRQLLGEQDGDRLGIGQHLVASRVGTAYDRWLTRESNLDWLRDNVPHMLQSTPGGRDALLAMMETSEARALVAAAQPSRFPAWTSQLDWSPVGRIRYFGLRPRGTDGEDFGTIYLYGSSLPASLLALVTRGDARMFARMARIAEPGRREAAVLFADVQASGTLSRRLPSASYFRLLTGLSTAVDSVIIRNGGIVGKHAGDGVTAFFLTDDLGSPSSAARAVIEASRDVVAAARATAEYAGEGLALNVGLHWGGTLYMGQLVTDGRLEVTALGDEVNECARIQETACDGAVLASKALIERLDDVDAAAVGVDPKAAHYRALADLPGASEKARRDAGGVAVTDLAT